MSELAATPGTTIGRTTPSTQLRETAAQRRERRRAGVVA